MDEKTNTAHSKSATINDVAKLSGASIATVSRVLSGSNYPVSEEMRKRVLDATHALRYSPNLLGHMLKSKTNKCLGIIIPSFQNPFFIQLTMGIENAAKSQGYVSFVFSSQRDTHTEQMLISQIQQLKISGLLLSATDHNPDTINAFLDTGASAVIFEADYSLDPRAINATSNMDENGYIATCHLLESGHKNIAFLTTPLTKRSRQMVSKGYHQAMDLYRIPPEDQTVFESNFERDLDDALFEFEAGKELTKQLLSSTKNYTAVVAVNDLVAWGVIHQLTQEGVRVPGDISVIGIDDIPQGMMISPTLTSISQSSYQHGYDVCLRLIERLESGNMIPNERCYRKPNLIIRESTRVIS
ncbi:MAG: LacI family transcriptional regulator [Lachnospiraceae bacterium]|jgi:LacI family transcriptional regulator|nr:LacI family transcriptional regulator [Lachnospiraceae bacterium]MCI9282885.1 LacI family transcriptional regulator [Lachnospiraceae bacterium]